MIIAYTHSYVHRILDMRKEAREKESCYEESDEGEGIPEVPKQYNTYY